MAPPSTIKAITINGNKAKVSEISLPKLRPTYLLVKVEAIALNPTDWKHINGKRAAENSISGCDFSGTVVEIGSGMGSSPITICTGCHHSRLMIEQRSRSSSKWATA
jgi:NADPH:quinone reductase-like Zn-dependent oxidoreductase